MRAWGIPSRITVARGRRIVPAVLLACLLAACGPVGPPVEEVARDVIPPDRTPVVLVPGVSREVGAELRGGRFVPFSALALRTDAEALANLGDPRFPTGGSRPLAIPARLDRSLRQTEVRGLHGLIERLVRGEGYLRGDPEQPLDKDYPENPESLRNDRTRLASLFVIYYDWRRDIAESACLLANRIARIRARTGAPRVYVVGHSLGGVVVRYYARYGGRDVMRDRDCPLESGGPAASINAPGASAIGAMVTLGAPHRGSALAFRGLMQDVNLWGVLSVGLRDAVFSMPMAWQLLPFAESDGGVPLLVGSNGAERIPLYDPREWIERGWVPGDPRDPEQRQFLETMLARARRLHQALQETSAAEDAVPRLVLGSACRQTLARAVTQDGKVEFLSRSDMDNPLFGRVTVQGDGVVSLDSALGIPRSPTLATMTVCTAHNAYADDPSVTDRIVQLFRR
jgi:pimeloyl-ACP methyl ester carboxylesterase